MVPWAQKNFVRHENWGLLLSKTSQTFQIYLLVDKRFFIRGPNINTTETIETTSYVVT